MAKRRTKQDRQQATEPPLPPELEGAELVVKLGAMLQFYVHQDGRVGVTFALTFAGEPWIVDACKAEQSRIVAALEPLIEVVKDIGVEHGEPPPGPRSTPPRPRRAASMPIPKMDGRGGNA